MKGRLAALWGGLVFVLATTGLLVGRKEDLLAHGTRVLLPLATDRPIIEGDHVRVLYDLGRRYDNGASDGYVIVRPGADGVATFRAFSYDGIVSEEGDVALPCGVGGGDLKIGPDAYDIPDGEASKYADAKYGDLRIGPGGLVLAGLLDASRKPIQ